jgi:hypothetical protein
MVIAIPLRAAGPVDDNERAEEGLNVDAAPCCFDQRTHGAGFNAVIITALTPYASAEFCVDSFRNRNLGTTADRT